MWRKQVLPQPLHLPCDLKALVQIAWSYLTLPAGSGVRAFWHDHGPIIGLTGCAWQTYPPAYYHHLLHALSRAEGCPSLEEQHSASRLRWMSSTYIKAVFMAVSSVSDDNLSSVSDDYCLFDRHCWAFSSSSYIFCIERYHILRYIFSFAIV